MEQVDSITDAVIEASLINIVAEMRSTLVSTVYTPMLYETHDFSCALTSPKGEVIAESEDFPLHIFPLIYASRAIREEFGDEIYPGDLFITNDPYLGGTHCNDVAVFLPFFFEDKLTLFTVVRAHWIDVGGCSPGSLSGKDTEIYQEGVCIPLTKVYERGKPSRALLELLFTNMRVREEREGDFLAQLDTCRTAERSLSRLFERYGSKVMEQCMASMLDRAEVRMRCAISKLPDGEWYYEDYLENSGTAPNPLPARGRMKIEGDTMSVDLTGTAAQVAGPTNSGMGGSLCGLFVILKTFLDPLTPSNTGALRPIKALIPKGTIVNAYRPAPMAGMGEVVFCAAEGMMHGLLAQVIPEKVSGAVRGSCNHIYFGGWDPARERHHILYEYPTSGTPACAENDGSNAVVPFDWGDVVTIFPVERVEMLHPIQITVNELIPDSGGPGYRRGGLALRRHYKVLSSDVLLSMLGQDAILPRWGMSGGYGGGLTVINVMRDGVEIQPSDIPLKVRAYPLKYGDEVMLCSQGGSGYGDPLTREVELVKQDVVDGYVTEQGAREDYGVVIVDGEVDIARTVHMREQLRKRRVYIRVVSSEVDEYDQRNCRLCSMSSQTAGKLGVKDGDAVEYVTDLRPPLRAWVTIADDLSSDESPLGPRGRGIINAKEGEKVWIRALTKSGVAKRWV